MEERSTASLGMRIVRWLLPYIRPTALRDLAKLEATYRQRDYPQPAPVSSWLQKNCAVSTAELPDGRVITLAPRTGGSGLQIFYLHGGAFVNSLIAPHWDILRKIIEATGATVTVPIYPLAPERDHRDGWRFVDAAFDQLVEKAGASPIAIGGDSAGGNFALSLAVRRRDAGLSLPGRIFLFAPWLDLSLADPAARDLEADDPLLAVDPIRICGQWWANGASTTDPALSPLYASAAGLPPIAIFQGTHDILFPDVRSFVQRAEREGADIAYFEYPGAFHVFMGAPFLSEARDVYRRLGKFLA